ncbi:hypothetical protein GOODEAATRI_012474 [Goodea atripinnis]|uniref:Secreted protein n=1 Tax=Goodea atripinnis TaxID=208336 RepID=A0ABV0NU47_9TELE
MHLLAASLINAVLSWPVGVHSHSWSGPEIGESEKIHTFSWRSSLSLKILDRSNQSHAVATDCFGGSIALIQKKKCMKKKVCLIGVSVAILVFKCSCAPAPLQYSK